MADNCIVNPVNDVFESVFKPLGYNMIKKAECQYESKVTQALWEGWKAARNYYVGRTDSFF